MTSSTGVYHNLEHYRGGQTLQTITTVMTDVASKSIGAGGTWEFKDFPISIALSKASNLVLVTGFISIGGQLSTHVGIRRNNSNVAAAMAVGYGSKRGAHSGAGGGGNDSHACCSCPIHFIDQPNTTSMLRYYLQLSHTSGGTQTLYINRSSNDGNNYDRGRYISILTAQEIQT
jgi:hypothetical protein